MRTTRAIDRRAPQLVRARANHLVDLFEKIATDCHAVLVSDPPGVAGAVTNRRWMLQIDGCARHGQSHIVSEYLLTWTPRPPRFGEDGGVVHQEALKLQAPVSHAAQLH